MLPNKRQLHTLHILRPLIARIGTYTKKKRLRRTKATFSNTTANNGHNAPSYTRRRLKGIRGACPRDQTDGMVFLRQRVMDTPFRPFGNSKFEARWRCWPPLRKRHGAVLFLEYDRRPGVSGMAFGKVRFVTRV